MASRVFSLPKAFSLVFGLLAAGTLAAQVLTAGPKTTTLETALFSVLQFLFSIAFAWLITGISARREFLASQKAFAIAAYRRINEIDEGIERLIGRAQGQVRSGSPETRHELEVVIAIAMGVRSSIKSSVADWGDVIGEEISTLNRIERIQDQQDLLADAPSTDNTAAPEPTDATVLSEQLVRSNEQITRLLATLPPALRVVAEKPKRGKDLVEPYHDRLRHEFDETSTITLRAFWDPSLQRDVRSMAVGDKVVIRIGTVGERMLAVCAHDETGQTVGIVINNGPGPYYVFREALVEYFHSLTFSATITSIEARNVGKRHYFAVAIGAETFTERRRWMDQLSAEAAEHRALTPG